MVDIIEPAPARLKISREAWALTAPELRAEILRAVAELEKGYAMHAAGSKRDAELAEFHTLAEAGGTTVREALRKYVASESLIRTDPMRGLGQLAAVLGIDFEQMMLERYRDELLAERSAMINKEVA